MVDDEFTGKILINDGKNTIAVSITGSSEEELYDIYNFMRNMKKEPGKYTLELKIRWRQIYKSMFNLETFIYWVGYWDELISTWSHIY